MASSPPLIGLFQVRVIKRNYRADGSHFSSTLRGRRTASRLRSFGRSWRLPVSEGVYDASLIDIYKGDQFGSGFVDLNPNSKISALIDYSVVKPVRIFESGVLLLYLAESSAASFPLLLWGAWNSSLGFYGRAGSAPYLGVVLRMCITIGRSSWSTQSTDSQ